jgi:hypothetical protein
MNPLTQFKKVRILALLIAPAFVALTAAPALATPSCGFTSTNPFSACVGGPLRVWLARLGVRE